MFSLQVSFSSLHWLNALTISLRTRRVKCDETKPFCIKCISTGRTCKGYMPPQPRKPRTCRSKYSVLDRSTVSSPGIPGTSLGLIAPGQGFSGYLPLISKHLVSGVDGDESRSLDYYRMRVSRDISGFFDTDFWNSHVLRLSDTEPAVRHAVIALSSLYEAYEISQLSQSSSSNRYDYLMRLAIRQYNKAISTLSNRINIGDPFLEVILITCLIFTWLEFLQGSTNNALAHLQSGLQILSEKRQRVISREIVNKVAQILGRLLIQATLHGSVTVEFDYNALVGYMPTPGLMRFTTLEEARCIMDGKINSILRFHRRIGKPGFVQSHQRSHPFPDPLSLECEYQAHIHDLGKWNMAFQDLKDRLDINLFTGDALQALYQLELCYLRISNPLKTLFATTPMVFDKYNDDYARMVYLSRLILQSQILRRSTSLFMLPFDVSVQGALFYVVFKCRHLPIRREALQLLQLCPDYEGIWQRASLVAFCNWKIAAEEKGRPEGALEIDALPENARVYGEKAREVVIDGQRRTMISFERGASDGISDVLANEEEVTNLSMSLAGLLGM